MNLFKLFSYFFAFLFFCSSLGALPTYFEYSDQDIHTLSSLSTKLHMSKKELQDQMATQATKNELPSSLSLFRFYTYLYAAQSDAAFLSYHVKGCFAGSLDPLSYGIIKLFYPEFHTSSLTNDPYSNALAKIVAGKMRERIQQEDSQPYQFKVSKEKEAVYVVGLNLAKWIPWYAKPRASFWPDPPPPIEDPVWKEEIKQIEKMQMPMTEEKKKAIDFWAGVTNPESGDWRMIANQYLFTHQVPLITSLEVRSILTKGLYDGLIVGFDAKYHYLHMRPKEFDSSVHYEIPVPKHPSYPANHAVMASIAATILSYFFPTEATHWQHLAEEAGLSRIWAGIHYPIDIRKGHEVGKKIGEHILEVSQFSLKACMRD